MNPTICDAFGFCAELLPEAVRLDEWGFPILDPDIPTDLLGAAREAVRCCPRKALSLIEVAKRPAATPPEPSAGYVKQAEKEQRSR